MYSLLFMRMRQEVLILFSRSPIPHIVYYRMSTIEQNTGNAQADKKECLMQEKKLEMYGGLFGGLIPLIVLVGGLVWLSVAERGGTKPFWACAWIALCVGIFFAKNKEEYCKAAMRGIGDRTGIVIVTAWLLAGVFGKLMAAGGLVQGLLWMGMTTGAQGGVFVVLVFLAAMLFALGTGTSTGT